MPMGTWICLPVVWPPFTHIGMSASWEVATATQITRSGATTTGTLAIQLADHIG
jgi:hypothetical protein